MLSMQIATNRKIHLSNFHWMLIAIFFITEEPSMANPLGLSMGPKP